MNQLTQSEKIIYNLIVNKGMSTRDIANSLDYTLRTTEIKISSILQKKQVKTQKELIVKHYKDIISRGTLCPSIATL